MSEAAERARRLRKSADWDPNQALETLTASTQGDARQEAAIGLGERQYARAVDALIDALSDPEERVVVAAIEALGRIGDSKALDAVAHHANAESWIVRAHVIRTL